MTKKKSDENKKAVRKNNPSKKNINVEKALIENFVSLQKVMTTMAIKFDSLSNQISKLLELFEISAKSMAEKGYSIEDRKMADKLDNLLEQNKIIAKGIALLHEKESYAPQQMQMPVQQMQRFPMPSQRIEPREIPPRQMPQQESPKVKEIGA